MTSSEKPIIIEAEAESGGRSREERLGMTPEAFADILSARIFAFVIDLAILGVIILAVLFLSLLVGIISFGLLWPGPTLVWVVVLAYFTLSKGGPTSATPGMRLMRIQMRTMEGFNPGYLVAFLHTVLYFLSYSFIFVLLLPLFNVRRRCLHDLLCGTIYLRSFA